MKCLFLEQQLHLFCLCSPVCAKGARTEHLHQLHTNQLFVKALIQIHPTKFSDAEVSMSLIVQRIPRDALPIMEGTEVLDPPPVTAWTYMKH